MKHRWVLSKLDSEKICVRPYIPKNSSLLLYTLMNMRRKLPVRKDFWSWRCVAWISMEAERKQKTDFHILAASSSSSVRLTHSLSTFKLHPVLCLCLVFMNGLNIQLLISFQSHERNRSDISVSKYLIDTNFKFEMIYPNSNLFAEEFSCKCSKMIRLCTGPLMLFALTHVGRTGFVLLIYSLTLKNDCNMHSCK